MQSYFIWNGIDCRTMGITLRGPAPIIRAEERVNHVTIPGRSGDLQQLEGENIYNSYIQTVSVSVRGQSNLSRVLNWLKGSGTVTFSSDPYRFQNARIIGAITLNKLSRNLDIWQGEVQFYCQPLKWTVESPSVLTSSGSVVNRGDVTAHPVIKVTPSTTTVTLTVNGSSFVVSGTVSGTVIVIDCNVQEVYNADRTQLLTVNSTGAFPVLEVGSNTFAGSGWSRLEIDRGERYL